MSPARWDVVHRLFHEAVDLPDAERSSFLEQSCGADLELRRHVENLIQADACAPTLLDASPDHLAMLLPDEEAEPGAADEIGPYRLLREIGRGGMGAVYLAERADGQFDRTVALKLVKRGMDTDEILHRFRHERQILAALEHPNIARLYDGGISPDGRPYLAMEYVDGQPIDAYCSARHLDVEQLVALFRSVCQAVQYAHQNLVVHRDLKPSNILVTGEGRVKLLDFGIAKLLGEAFEDLSAPVTRTGMRVLTPAYAAPEQLEGKAITTATDVYALGVILYALMTGQRPYDLAVKEGANVEVAVLVSEPRRPSSIADDRMRRRLRGDLDTIILKALRKEPERRYGSAAAMLDDLERHLAGLPVAARPDTIGYRARTFVRRNKTTVAAGLLVLLALVGGLGTALWHARRAAHERDVALQVSSFLETLFRAPSPSLHDSERLDTLRLGDLLRFGSQKVQSELQRNPQLQGKMMLILGNVFNELALYDEAGPLLEDALVLRTRLYGDRHVEVAEVLEALGLLHHHQGAYAAAESLHVRVLSMRTALLGGNHPSTALSHNNLAAALEYNSRYDDALPHYRRAYEIASRHRSSDPGFFAEVSNNLGQLYFMQDDYAAAEPLYRESVETLRGQPNPRHPKLALSLNNLALVIQYAGDREAAEQLLLESLSITKDVYGEVHPEISVVLQNLAVLHGEMGHHAAEDSLYRKALEIDLQVHGRAHPGTGLTMRNLALNRFNVGEHDEAEHMLREALSIFEISLPEDHLYRAITEAALGKVLTRRDKLDEAEAYLHDGLAALTQQLPENHWLIATARRDLGAYYLARGEVEQADTLLLAAYPILLTRGGEGLLETLEILIELHEAQDAPEEAAMYREQLALHRESPGT